MANKKDEIRKALKEGGKLTFGEVVEKADVSTRTADKWLDRMIESGSVVKKQSRVSRESYYTLNPGQAEEEKREPRGLVDTLTPKARKRIF